MAKTRLDAGTWVLVADGEKALFLENVGDADYPNFRLRRLKEQDNPPDREQGTDRPGRIPGPGGGPLSAMQETDWHRLAKDRFADELADMLYARAHRGAFRSLAIVAAPAVLGEIRAKMHKEVADRLVAEIPKTLTNHPIDRIEEMVRQALASDG